MGSWKVKNVSETSENHDEIDVSRTRYGNKIHVKLEMKYYKNSSGQFEEMPHLEWFETITYTDHQKREWWTFEVNMYDHNPNSKTLAIWLQRYISAYNAAKGIAQPFVLGSSVLFKKVPVLGYQKVKGKDLTDVTGAAEKTQVVQEYLRKNGGKLVIEITDRPSVGYPTDGSPQVNIERMLLFDVGLQNNSAPRWKGYQHVKLDQAHPQSWTRDVKSGFLNTEPPHGYTKIAAPVAVTKPRDPAIIDGEVL